MFKARPFATALIATLTVAFLGAAPALAAQSTTAPTNRVEIYVLIGDQKIQFAIYRNVNTEDPGNTETILEQSVARGNVATFIVENRGKQPHNFTLLGRKVPTLKPGGQARFTTPLLTRGSFTYESTVGKVMKGTFIVY